MNNFRTVCNTALDMKKNWDEMIEAKTIERHKLEELLEDEEEDDDDDYDFEDEAIDLELEEDVPEIKPLEHLVPEIIVTNQEERKRKPLYQRHSKPSYAAISRSLTVEKEEPIKPPKIEIKASPELVRTNWKNKELKIKSSKVPPMRPKPIDDAKPSWVREDNRSITSQQDGPIRFSKTYSFKNLPKGRVAKLQKQFEQNLATAAEEPLRFQRGSPLPHLRAKMDMNLSSARPIPSRFDRSPSPSSKRSSSSQPMVAIQTWEEKTSKSLPSSSSTPYLDELLQKPGSRKGFYASTPSLTQALDQTLSKETSLSEENLPKPNENPQQQHIKEYLESLRDRRDKARQNATSECFSSPFKQSLLPAFPRERYFFAYEKVVSWTGFAYKVQSNHDVHIISTPVYV